MQIARSQTSTVGPHIQLCDVIQLLRSIVGSAPSSRRAIHMVLLALPNLARERWHKAFQVGRTKLIVSLMQSNVLAEQRNVGPRHNDYLRKLRIGVKHMGALALSQAHGRIKIASQTDEGVIFNVENEEEASQLEMWQQGDASLQTREKMAQRADLRRDRRVRAVLQMVWEAAHMSYGGDGDPMAMSLGFQGYSEMMKRIPRVLLRKYDETDAINEISKDWQKDSKGSDRIERVAFCDALFELTDTWTAGISAYEYAAFLKQLLMHIARENVDGVWGWKAEEECTWDPAYGDDEEVEEEIRAEEEGGDVTRAKRISIAGLNAARDERRASLLGGVEQRGLARQGSITNMSGASPGGGKRRKTGLLPAATARRRLLSRSSSRRIWRAQEIEEEGEGYVREAGVGTKDPKYAEGEEVDKGEE